MQKKCAERDETNNRLSDLQQQEKGIEEEKEKHEQIRRSAKESLDQLGGGKAMDAKKVQDAYSIADRERSNAEKELLAESKSMGIALALSRFVSPLQNRLKAEELRETWERLREGTIERADQVLNAAIPEPPSSDPLLGNLSVEIREQVKERFRSALDQIYNHPPSGCASEYLFGHAKGDARRSLLEVIQRVRRQGAVGYWTKQNDLQMLATSSKLYRHK